MSAAQDQLSAELSRKLRAHRVVVWDDPKLQYGEVASAVVPEGAAFAAYDGSWFALRQRIEPLLSQPEPGPLVIYVPAPRPKQDPLEEARQAGISWSIALETLLSKSFARELTAGRIAALARQSRTLTEAEAAMAGGSVDARVITAFRTPDVVEIAAAVLTGERDGAVAGEAGWASVSETLASHFGGQFPTLPEPLRVAMFRHLALVVLAGALGSLPDAWSGVTDAVTGQQLDRCRRVLDRLREPGRLQVHRRLGQAFDNDLDLSAHLAWSDALGEVDVSPGMEDIALAEALRRLDMGDPSGACSLAEQRLQSSRWAQPHWTPGEALAPTHPYRQWDALQRVATLMELVHRLPPKASTARVLAWYASDGWEVDRAHRLMELARADLGHAGDLDRHIRAARDAYEGWLEKLAATMSTSVSERGWELGTLLRQAETFGRVVRTGTGLTAYVLVDALRYELGMALAQRLGRGAGEARASCLAAVAAAPTITPVGMANLLPGAEDGLSLTVGAGGDLCVSVAGTPVANPKERIDLLRRQVGMVADFDFSTLMSRGDEALRSELASADLVVVRSGDIDAAGESGRSGGAWRAVDGSLDDLATQILRLGRLGVARAVVTADHGFVVLSEALSSGRVLARPPGGDLHRRCWLGQGGLTPGGAYRLKMSDLGVAGGLDLVVPEGLSVFPLPGTRQFFHGGLTPQELIVPVLVVDVGQTVDEPARKVAITVSGKGITTGVFAATLSFVGTLFRSQVTVRVLARTATGQAQAARLVAGDGFEPASGTVTVGMDPVVLTFQVTASLQPSTPVELQVLDAATGLQLATVKVPVRQAVTIEEGWL